MVEPSRTNLGRNGEESKKSEKYLVIYKSGGDATRQTAGSVPEDVLSVGLDNTGRHLHSLISW